MWKNFSQDSSSRHHILISGTGRAGTTFLVELATELGLDTGFSDPQSSIFENCNAGLEWDLASPSAPYIVKSPFLCTELDQILSSHPRIVVDHLLVPVRDLRSAAQSRIEVSGRSAPGYDRPSAVPGGLWGTDDSSQQADFLAQQLYRLMETAAVREIPVTLLSFPRLVRDQEYLYERLSPVLPRLRRRTFSAAFRKVSRPELVHEFRGGAADSKPEPTTTIANRCGQ